MEDSGCKSIVVTWNTLLGALCVAAGLMACLIFHLKPQNHGLGAKTGFRVSKRKTKHAIKQGWGW